MDRIKTELFKKKNVVLVGRGKKLKDGVDTGRDAIVVGVVTKEPENKLCSEDLIPKKVGELETDVIKVGKIRALGVESEKSGPSHTTKYRPAPGGISIGHKSITAGTLGMIAKKNGVRYILSNNHVLANENNCEIGDEILQPGPYDGGTVSADCIGTLCDYVEIDFGTVLNGQLDLIHPNGGEIWYIGNTEKIEWETELTGNLRVEISFNSGGNWYTLVQTTPAELGYFDWKIDVQTTENARIKLVSLEGVPVETSDADFSLRASPLSDCSFSNAIANGFNLLAKGLGKKTRLLAVVPQRGRIISTVLNPNIVDCALAKPNVDTDVLDEILEIGTPKGTAEAILGMKVKKSGRSSCLSQGEVTLLDATVEVAYSTGSAMFEDQIVTSRMSEGGDSGSIVLTEDNKVVGMLFAGSVEVTILNRIENVVKGLGLDEI